MKANEGPAKAKYRYRVTYWTEYDRALVNRGNLTIWFDEASIQDSWTPPQPIGRGKPGLYSEFAIQTFLTLKTLFRLPYSATEGLLKSLMQLCQLVLTVPDHTHMWRRAGTLTVKIPRRPHKGPVHVGVDSTVLKIFGKGKWKVRQHGMGKRRTWRKIPLEVDESAKDIIGIEVTSADWGDSEILSDLLDQVEGHVAQVSADGAYDAADALIKDIAVKGRVGWKDDSGYYRRSIAKNMMYRLKQLGEKLFSRVLDIQVDEAHIGRPSSTVTPTSASRNLSGLGKCVCCMKRDRRREIHAGNRQLKPLLYKCVLIVRQRPSAG